LLATAAGAFGALGVVFRVRAARFAFTAGVGAGAVSVVRVEPVTSNRSESFNTGNSNVRSIG
jgi:hypothetical protein